MYLLLQPRLSLSSVGLHYSNLNILNIICELKIICNMKVEATLLVTGTTCLVDTVCLSYWKYSCWWWRRRKVLARYSFSRDAWTPRPEMDTLHNSSAACVNLPLSKLMKKDGERIIEVCCRAGTEDLLVSHVSLAELLALLRLSKRGDEAVLIFGLSGVMQKTGTRFTALFCNGQRCGEKSGVHQETLMPKDVPQNTVQGSEDKGVDAHQDNTEDRDDPEQISNPSMEEEREYLTQNSFVDDEGVMTTTNMAAHTVTDQFDGSEERNRSDDPEEDEDVYFHPRKTLLIKWWNECMKKTTNLDTAPRQDKDLEYLDQEEEITDQPRHTDNKNTFYTNWKKENNVYMEDGSENGLSKLAEDEDGVHNDDSDESSHYIHPSDEHLDHSNEEGFCMDHRHEYDGDVDSSCMDHESDDKDHSHINKVHAGHSYENSEYMDHRPQYMVHHSEEMDYTCRKRRNTNGSRTHTDKKDHYNINSNTSTNMPRIYYHNMYLQKDVGYLNNMDQYCHHTPEERAYFGHSGTYWNYAKGYKVYTDYNDRGNMLSNTSRQGCIKHRRNQYTHTRLPSYNPETSAIANENIPRGLCPQRPTSTPRSAYIRLLGVGLLAVVLLVYLIVLCRISY